MPARDVFSALRAPNTPQRQALGAQKEAFMFYGLLAAILLVVGVLNLTSESSGFIGWLLSALGGVLLLYQLSGPTKARKRSKTGGGGAHYSDSGNKGDSGYSGGDGGGGGD